MDVLKYVMIGVACIAGGYILFRLLSIAIFTSWFDVKKQKERRNDNGSNKRFIAKH